MYVHESVIHYVAAYLERHEIPSNDYKKAREEMRNISNQLLETLRQPRSINVIRHIPTQTD
jgi:hypothetical protein